MPHSEPAIDIENIGGNQVKGLWDDNGAKGGVSEASRASSCEKKPDPGDQPGIPCLRQAPCLAQELNIESHFNLQTKTTVL